MCRPDVCSLRRLPFRSGGPGGAAIKDVLNSTDERGIWHETVSLSSEGRGRGLQRYRLSGKMIEILSSPRNGERQGRRAH